MSAVGPRSPLRLAFLTSQLTRGGGERQLVRTAAHLAEAGAEVLVLSTTADLGAMDVEGWPEHQRLRVLGISQESRAARLRAARDMLVAARPGVLVGWLRPATVWGPLLQSAARIPAFRLAERTTLEGYSPTWRRARLLASRRADRVVANSEHAAQQWRSVRPQLDVRVARNFPPPRRVVSPPPSSDRVRFAVVGRHMPAKGIDVAIDALAIACAGGLDAELLVVGRDFDGGRSIAARRAQAVALGIGDRVSFRPPDLDDTGDVAAHADVLVIPSRWEGSSNVLAEALAVDMPVLASEAVVPPWEGIHISRAPVGDPAALAALMVERAWMTTSVADGVWEAWAEQAKKDAEEAWLA